MFSFSTSAKTGWPIVKPLLALGLAGLVTACASTPDYSQTNNRFYQCRGEVNTMMLGNNNAAQLHGAAKVAEQCLTELDAAPNSISQQQAMRLHALSVYAYLAAGDAERATVQLQTLELQYPHHDLYLADGSSFVQSLQLLLGEVAISQANPQSLLNASATVKQEIQRIQYWQSH